MQDLIILGTMLACAGLPFWLCTRLQRAGKSGAVLTIVSLIGASFVILYFAANGSLGIDPVRAIAWALVLALPALFGSIGGALLGHLLRKRDERN